MSIGYLCQWIFYAVFAAVSACCVLVSHADVLTRSAFREICAVFSGGCRFPADLIFPLGKATVVLFYNAFHFSESPHKNLYIGITVRFECIGDFIPACRQFPLQFLLIFTSNAFRSLPLKSPLCIRQAAVSTAAELYPASF